MDEYHRFKPKVKNSQINAYDCSCLTSDNKCSDYQSRPSLCVNYPHSYFYEHGHIHSSCGYKVSINQDNFRLLFPNIKQKLFTFYKNS